MLICFSKLRTAQNSFTFNISDGCSSSACQLRMIKPAAYTLRTSGVPKWCTVNPPPPPTFLKMVLDIYPKTFENFSRRALPHIYESFKGVVQTISRGYAPRPPPLITRFKDSLWFKQISNLT